MCRSPTTGSTILLRIVAGRPIIAHRRRPSSIVRSIPRSKLPRDLRSNPHRQRPSCSCPPSSPAVVICRSSPLVVPCRQRRSEHKSSPKTPTSHGIPPFLLADPIAALITSSQHSVRFFCFHKKMAANFWTSSHFKQLLDQEEVDVVKSHDKEKGITLEDFKLIKMHMANYISKLAQNVKVRQRVVATAVTYMRRVYVRKSMVEYDPRLVAPTCLYLAAKAEESIVQARLLSFYIKKLYSDEKYRYEIKDILEMEMKVLEALNYFLVVFHPYRALSQLLLDAGINDIGMTQTTWGIINDTYKMDLILIHPPHMIALACIYIASVLKDKDTTAWFEELRVDMNVVKNISMEILDFYDSLKTITDEKIGTALNKLTPKA